MAFNLQKQLALAVSAGPVWVDLYHQHLASDVIKPLAFGRFRYYCDELSSADLIGKRHQCIHELIGIDYANKIAE